MLQRSWLPAWDPEICSHTLSSTATPNRCSWDILNKMLNKNTSSTVSALKSCSLLSNCQRDCQQHSASSRTNIKTRVFSLVWGSMSTNVSSRRGFSIQRIMTLLSESQIQCHSWQSGILCTFSRVMQKIKLICVELGGQKLTFKTSVY